MGAKMNQGAVLKIEANRCRILVAIQQRGHRPLKGVITLLRKKEWGQQALLVFHFFFQEIEQDRSKVEAIIREDILKWRLPMVRSAAQKKDVVGGLQIKLNACDSSADFVLHFLPALVRAMKRSADQYQSDGRIYKVRRITYDAVDEKGLTVAQQLTRIYQKD
ncbi:hypothetical protein KJ616_03120 [Patescibacteria group bacterium]|nr:hypothetical protein [Patescibacteria group bacterium]